MKTLVSDALWQRLQPLLPPPPSRRFRFPGRQPLDRRTELQEAFLRLACAVICLRFVGT
jgi:transposase